MNSIHKRFSFRRTRGVAAGLFCLFLLLCVQGVQARAAHAAPAAPQSPAAAPLCRFGVNVNTDTGLFIDEFDTAPLRIGWYLDYYASASPSRPNGVEYAPVIRLQQVGANGYTYSPNGSALDAAISGNPGAMWLIGNEPDRLDFQDDIEPHVYAKAYHDLYNLIRAKDPTARILAGSIVQATEVRLKYLDMVLSSYRAQFGRGMPVDAWSIHGFILNEVSCARNPDPAHLGCWGADIPPGVDDATGLVLDGYDTPPNDGIERTDDFNLFVEQIERFRSWMAARGYRNTPLYLSEYGVLMPAKWYPQFDAARVNAFMTKTFDYLLTETDPNTGYPSDGNRLVQRLSWYSTSDKDNHNGNLYDPDDNNQLSAMGEHYAAYAGALSEETDFYPLRIQSTPPVALVGAGPTDFTLRAVIANSGNTQADRTTTVRFYDGDPANGGVQIGTDQTVALGGCGAEATAQVVWTNVPAAPHRVYVIVDPANNVGETDEDNNTASRDILLLDYQSYLPLVGR